MAKALDLTGHIYNRLTVITLHPIKKYDRRIWECLCICGKTVLVGADKLRSGHSKSCGCLQKENYQVLGAKRAATLKTHGMTKSSTFSSWTSMHHRCTKNCKNKVHYYNRGITVCQEWMNFETFLQDMGIRPKFTTLDRIDVNLGYYKENCRWATSKQQQRNKTNTRYLLLDGKKVPLMEIADQLGIKKNAAQYFFSVLKTMEANFKEIKTNE